MNVYLVVMAGGSGTRFWPKSRAKMPKQLLAFRDAKKTLIELAIDRFAGWISEDHTYVVTTELLGAEIRQKVGKRVHVLEEPAARNTAPCVYWATREIAAHDPGAVCVVVPADH